jgi:hypothetical protein
LSQLARLDQLKTKGNGETIRAPSTTERRESHRESAFRRNKTKNNTVLRTASRRNKTKNNTVLRTASRRNETKNKTVLRTSSENGHAKTRRWWLSTNAHNWLRFPPRQHFETRPRTRRSLASQWSSREQDIETNGLISAPGTRTPSAAHHTIECAAESEIGPTPA